MNRPASGTPTPSNNLDKSTFKQPVGAFDDLALLAAHTLDTPLVVITLQDNDGPFIKSSIGVDAKKAWEVHAFAEDQDEVTIVEDARKDKRFKGLACVSKAPHFVFYAGVTLKNANGERLGTLAVLDRVPRQLTSKQVESLQLLSRQVIQLLEIKKLENTPIQNSPAQPDAERLKSILEASRVGTWEWNVQTGEVNINERWAEIIGYTAAELEPINIDMWYRALHPDDREHTDRDLQACLNKEVAFYDTQCRLLHKDGHEVWIHDRGQVISWTDDGEPLWMMGTHTDITEEKNTEKQLLAISDNIPGAVFRYRLAPGGKDSLEMVSKGAYELWGVTAEEAMQDHTRIWKNFDKEDLERVRERICASARTLSHWQCEWRYHHPDGTIKWHRGTGNPSRSEDGSTIWDAMILDVTEQKKTEIEIQLREKRYRALVENGADAILILDKDSRVNYVSPSIKRVLGYNEKEALELNLIEAIHPDDLPGVMAKMQEVLENPGTPMPGYTARTKHKDGSWRWLDATITNLLHDPVINGIIDNFRDVTERVEFEQSLKDSEEKYRLLFDTSPLPMWIYDLNSCSILDVNQTTTEKYGYSREEFLNLHINELRPESELPALKQVVKSVKKLKGSKRFGIFTHLKKSGESMRMDVSGHRLQFDNKDGLLVVCNEVTEQESAFKALETSEARYRGFYESQTNYVIRTDMDGNYSYVNKKFEDDFGWVYPDGDIIGSNCLPSIMEYDHPKVIEVVEKCVQSPGKVHKVEIDKPSKGRGTVTTLWEFVCILNDRGEPVEIQCVGLDITDRITTERALSESHERYELVNRATNDAIYDWDVKNDSFIWGDGFYRILNYAPNKFKTFSLEDWNKLTHPADSTAHQKAWEEFLADENAQKWENEFRFQRADGSFAHVGEIGYMIRDENGRPERMIGVLRDQTQVKLAEIQQDILRDVSQRFKESGSLSATLQEVLKYLTEAGKYKIAEIWLKSDYDMHLNRVAQYSKSRSGQLFLSESTGSEQLHKGEGLLGAVWKKNELIVWNDVHTKKTFVRRKAAAKAGLLTMVGVPIAHNEQVVGVMVLGSGESNCKTESNVELMRTIGPFLGAEIIRKNQEEELHLFFKNAPEILTVVNPNGYFSKVNPAFVQALGFTEKELTSQPIVQFLHPDDVAATSEEYGMNLSVEHLADYFINRYRTKEGAYKWISWKSSKTFGRDGQFFGYGRDITEQKLAEQDLQNRTRQLNAIATINSRLINYENWYQVIDESFAQIAEVVQVDRVYYFKNSIQQTTGQAVTSQILEWTRENVEPQIDNPELQELPIELIEEFFEPMFKNNPYQGHSKNIKNTALREMLMDQDIKSILCLPIIVDKNIWGIIGFDDCTRERIWTTDEVVFLRTIAANLATAIESHETDLKLKEAHDERSNILESIGDAFFAVDNNWVVTYWNKEAEKVLGRSKDEMIGEVLWDQYEDAKSLKFYTEYHRAMETGKVVDFEEHYPETNSWYEVSAYPSKKGLSVYFKDVTLRKNAHEQIRLTKERFEKVTQATNDAIWDFDVIKNELFWGQGFDTLFGYNAQNTTPTFELLLSKIHPEDRDRVAAKVQTYMGDDSATNWYEEYRFLKADGTFTYVIDRAVFIRNHQGEVTRVVGAMTDISYRKEHERKLQNLNEQLEKHAKDLERSNAELEQFAYIASHDLQEPLRMVTSFLNQLESKYNDQLDDKAQQYIYFAVDGARRMRQIILDLLEFSRVGRLEEKQMTIDLNEIINGYSVLRKKAIEEKSASLVYDKLPEITTYKTPVTQVFHNLIDNAIKYARPGVPPKVEIKATDRGNQWEFEVRDNGIGIEEEYFEKIFVIFQRLHDKSEYSGTGMGLAIVRKIIENLGGKIWLASKPGKGSSFHFTLPKQP